MKIALYKTKEVTFPAVKEATFSEFITMLHEDGHNTSCAGKLDYPCFSPMELRPGMPRLKANVARVHFGVIDLDRKTPEELDAVLEDVRGSGLQFAFYTTFSHLSADKDGLCAARLCVPFSRPVEAHEWPRFWPAFNELFGTTGDEQCKDASRIYFVPSAPISMLDDAYMEPPNEGEALDIDSLLGGLSASGAAAHAVPGSRKITIDDLIEKKAQIGKSRTERWTFLKPKLKALIGGDSLGEVGERDTVIFRMTRDLVELLPGADAASLARLFIPSLKMMSSAPEDANWVDDVQAKIERAQDDIQNEAVAKQNAIEVSVKHQTKIAFGTGRDTPYTTAELESFAALHGVDPTALRDLWIIQKDVSYYVFVAGAYKGPYTQAEIEKAAQVYLAPASSAGVELQYPTSKGDLIPKDSKKLVRDYGSLASAIHVDLSAQKSRFDIATQHLVEAPCPLRNLTPEYSPYIAKWLSLLGGKAESKLLDWIASATRLDVPCAAIYFDGVKNAGKTLFAKGMARLWSTRGHTSLSDAMGNWNSTITACPLVFGDEVVPTDWRGHAKTGELREFIQAETRTLKRKYLADAAFHGCVRLILAANNKDLLASNEPLTANDIEAIVDRVLYIKVEQAAADYLREVPREARLRFVKGDAIAKHALWLRDNRVVESDHRFIVEGDKGALHRALTTNAGLRSAVMHLCVAYLLEPKKIEPHCGLLIRKYGKHGVDDKGKKILVGGKLLVTTRGMMAHWGSYTTNVYAPAAGQLSKAIAGVSEDKRKKLLTKEGRYCDYRVIDTENMIVWADETGFANRKRIEEALSVPSVEDNSNGTESFEEEDTNGTE